MQRAFVTGGSGFVGRRLIELLAREGVAVAALARSDTAAHTVREAGAAAVVTGDLDDLTALGDGMAGADVVFHAAAVVTSWGDPATFHRVNVGGTERMLSAARGAGVKRVVHVSTEAVLVGGGPIVRADETRPLPTRPIGLYPTTKGEAERRVVAAGGDGLTTVIVRPRFVWGKGDTSVLPQFERAVRAGQFAWIDGGRYLTSTCHVDNVAEGTIAAARHGRSTEAYFLTDGEPVEFRQFVGGMLAAIGVDPGRRSVPGAVARAVAAIAEPAWRWLPLPGAPPLDRTAVRLMGEEVTVDDTKARRELGYVGRVTVEAGLREMAAAR